MRVPNRLKTARYYLYTGNENALSSWATLKAARACYKRLQAAVLENPHRYEADLASVRSILEVTTDGRFAHSFED